MLHSAPNQTYFLEFQDYTGQSENAENLTKVFEEAIVLAKEMYNTKIFAIVSDNASPMVRMGKDIEVWHLTCRIRSGGVGDENNCCDGRV